MQGKYIPIIYDSYHCVEQSIETCGETWTEGIPFMGSAVAAMQYMLGVQDRRQTTGDVAEVIMVILAVPHHEMLYLIRQGMVTRTINGDFGSGWVWKFAKDFTTNQHRVHSCPNASVALEDAKTMDEEGFARIARTLVPQEADQNKHIDEYRAQTWRQRPWFVWCDACRRSHTSANQPLHETCYTSHERQLELFPTW